MFRKISLLILVVLLGSILACAGQQHYVKDIGPQAEVEVEVAPVVVKEVKAEPVAKEVEIPQVVKIEERVFFDFDSFNLDTDAILILKKVALLMEKYPETLLVLKGHTDKYGPEEYNQILSENRAGAVKEYLVELDVPADRIVKVEGFGKTQLLPELTNRENRRVVILSIVE